MKTLIRRAVLGDAGEIMVVQRAAYVTEAQLYQDPMLPPLTELYEDVQDAVRRSIVLVATSGPRIVGAVRGLVVGPVCHVSRLAVAPDMQGVGIGSSLVDAIEDAVRDTVEEMALFTGERSEENLRLYRRRGYVETSREVASNMTLVHLTKSLAG